MDEREKKSGGAGCCIAGVFCFFILGLYVLGIGPATLLANHVDETQGIVGAVYIPLVVVCELCEPAQRAIDWYVDLWL